MDVTSTEIDMFGEEYVRRLLDQHGIKVSSYIYFDEFADEKNQEKAIMRGMEAIDTAKNFGAKVAMMVPMGQKGVEEVSREQLAKNMIACWQLIAAYGKVQGIHVVIEDTPDQRIPLCTMEELKYVLDAVPDLEVVYDSGNMLLAYEDPVTYFDTFKDRIAHIHIKDMKNAEDTQIWADIARDGKKMTCAPTGTGLVDMKTLIRHIKESGYNEYLTIEFCMEPQRGYVGSLVYAKEFIEKLWQAGA